MRSRQRVADHGEVFTPASLVDAMLDLVKTETERIESRVLEPACGSGNFLVPILRRKLVAVELKYGRSEFEKRHYALLGLMCIYGIELLSDNVAECRKNLLGVFADYLAADAGSEWLAAAKAVLDINIVHGDALAMTTRSGLSEPMTFAEWAYLGRGQFKRRDFRFDAITKRSSFGDDTLFADLGKHEIFVPVREHPLVTVKELAGA